MFQSPGAQEYYGDRGDGIRGDDVVVLEDNKDEVNEEELPAVRLVVAASSAVLVAVDETKGQHVHQQVQEEEDVWPQRLPPPVAC
mmetsp:Transcript_15370/g.23174  ORF Transcript_15370/g.23174 Transcript_15370/m.23174 type:complete len:85 (-) Transcript_15370:8-262(-)